MTLKYLYMPFVHILARLRCQMNAADQAEHNLGLATARVPPSWCSENDRNYPLRTWIKDVELWSAATDVPLQRQAPAILIRLTGAVRILMREVPVHLLTDGQDYLDEQGNLQHRTGVETLLRFLSQRYGALPQETQIFLVSELMQFHRNQRESTDEMLSRWDVVMMKAIEGGGITAFVPPIRSWIILSHLRIPRTSWPQLLSPTRGMLPTTEDEYHEMISYIRRNSHLYEYTGDRSKSLQQPYFSTESEDPQSNYTSWSEPASSWSESQVPWFEPVQTYPAYDDMHDDTHSWHSFSTGNSEPDEELDWTDVDAVPPIELPAYLFHQYLFAKRRFRAVGFKRSRFVGRPKGKGKGKSGKGFGKRGKGQGKGGHGKHQQSGMIGFWMDESTLALEAETAEYDKIYFKGGKGGVGAGKGNPIGKDGQKLKCLGCGSEEHFIRACPKGKGKSKSSGKGKSSSFYDASSVSASSSAFPSYPQMPDPTTYPPAGTATPSGTHAGLFMATAFDATVENIRTDHTRITFMDGSPSIEIQSVPSRVAAMQLFGGGSVVQNTFAAHAIVPSRSARHDLFYPWWDSSEADLLNTDELTTSYHSRVRLAKGESVLIDTGAIKPLAGDAWCKRAAEAAAAFGRGTVYEPLAKVLTVEGVGTGSNRCTHRAIIPVAFEDGVTGTYSPAVVPDSEIPALASFDILERRRVVLDCFNGKYFEMGPGGYDIHLSPGSRVVHMHKAPTGHPMLPVTEWSSVKPGETQVYASK